MSLSKVTSCGFVCWGSIPGNGTENFVFIMFRRALSYPQPQDTGNPLLLCVGLAGGALGSCFNAPLRLLIAVLNSEFVHDYVGLVVALTWVC